jgi:hypothetical protein
MRIFGTSFLTLAHRYDLKYSFGELQEIYVSTFVCFLDFGCKF